MSAGRRMFSADATRTGPRPWIMTEAKDDSRHRACTAIYLPLVDGPDELGWVGRTPAAHGGAECVRKWALKRANSPNLPN